MTLRLPPTLRRYCIVCDLPVELFQGSTLGLCADRVACMYRDGIRSRYLGSCPDRYWTVSV